MDQQVEAIRDRGFHRFLFPDRYRTMGKPDGFHASPNPQTAQGGPRDLSPTLVATLVDVTGIVIYFTMPMLIIGA